MTLTFLYFSFGVLIVQNLIRRPGLGLRVTSSSLYQTHDGQLQPYLNNVFVQEQHHSALLEKGRRQQFTQVLQSFRRAAIAAVTEDVAAGRRQCLLEVSAIDGMIATVDFTTGPSSAASVTIYAANGSSDNAPLQSWGARVAEAAIADATAKKEAREKDAEKTAEQSWKLTRTTKIPGAKSFYRMK